MRPPPADSFSSVRTTRGPTGDFVKYKFYKHSFVLEAIEKDPGNKDDDSLDAAANALFLIGVFIGVAAILAVVVALVMYRRKRLNADAYSTFQPPEEEEEEGFSPDP